MSKIERSVEENMYNTITGMRKVKIHVKLLKHLVYAKQRKLTNI